MLAAGADDGLVAMDLVTLLQQAGRAEEAAAEFAKAARPDAPSYALLATTRANRDLRRTAEAERLAREGARRFRDEPVWPLLLSLVLSDAGRSGEALALLRSPAAAGARPVERRLAEAYAHRRAGDRVAALRAYADAMALDPTNDEARREQGAILSDLGGPYGAAAIDPARSTSAAERAAALVRWGAAIRGPDPARRFDGTDAALARLDGLLAATPASDAALRRRLRLDRLVALRDRVRMSEVVDEGDALRRDGPLPSYADAAYGDALLFVRRAADARAAYDRVLAGTPTSLAARYGHFYASLELEDFTAAYADVDILLRDIPVWRTYAEGPTRYPNRDRTDAEVTAARVRLYGNQLAEAWERIAGLAAAAPANPDVRLAAYEVANARGWPRLAQQEAEIAASLAPRSLGTRLASVEVAIAAHRYADAAAMLEELRALYPDDLGVQRVARELAAQRGWLLELEARPSDSTGGGANAAGRGREAKSLLYSPPIADHWRLFGLADYSSAEPPEGFVERARYGAGLEYRTPYLRLAAFPTLSSGTLGRAGGGGTLDWSATDQLKLSFGAEAFSPETPLRAVRHHITSDEYAARIDYRWHESRSISLRGSLQPFSDDNQRTALGLVYQERLVALPHFELTGLGELFRSWNTRSDVPYYSPRNDFSAIAGAKAEHVLWRQYEISFSQAVQLDAGLYAQHGFADDWIGTASYEHRWRFDPSTEFHYAVRVSRRVYDGDGLREISVLLGLRQRI
jgi:biofilm PGA synthesis protein PgaA